MTTNKFTAWGASSLSAGINTAASSVSAGTAVIINYMTLSPNPISGSAGAWDVLVEVGLSAGGVIPRTIFQNTVTASGGYQYNGVITLPHGYLMLISASSGSALDYNIFGMEQAE